MILYSHRDPSNAFRCCGGKAYRMAVMAENGYHVPKFLCLTEVCDSDALDHALDDFFPEETLFSVRSSADVEDSASASFAGQFDTFLNVDKCSVADAVIRCFDSVHSTAVKSYNSKNGNSSISMNVVVQRMIPSELSGVMFTQNPLGILSEAVIVVGNGEGCNVVSDKVDTTAYYHNVPDGKEYYIRKNNSPLLGEECYRQLLESGKELEGLFHAGLDIEFAVAKGELYFLQARPITGIKSESSIVLDNSNIVESYPGITLPLTESFVKTVYTEIFINLMGRLAGRTTVSRLNGKVFDSMVEGCNGRIFYNIKSWYYILRLLPFSNKIIPIWQEMLGVNEDMQLPKREKAVFAIKLRIAASFVGLLFTVPFKMIKLKSAFSDAEAYFYEHFSPSASYDDLYRLYEYLRDGILKEWDITLANDMYSFLMTAAYKNSLRKKGLNESECNNKISGINDIESMKPVLSMIRLAVVLGKDGESNEYKELLSDYLEKFGDRSVGELKLETETFRERRDLLEVQIKAFASMEGIEEKYKELSENKDFTDKSFYGKRAAIGIANREYSRMNRSRLFGFARRIFMEMGRILAEEGRLIAVRDVFYLTTEELKNAYSGINLKAIVADRKQLYQTYETLPDYRRLVFADKIINKPVDSVTAISQAADKNVLSGVPCSSGIVRGTVVVIDEPTGGIDTNGKIIVTRSTDPGWVFMLTCAKGIIAEKGSLLSHTAIISRELGIPSIVGVDNATDILKDGDIVEMNCDTGLIKKD